MTKHDKGSIRIRWRQVGLVIGIGVVLGGAIGTAIGLLWPKAGEVGSVTNHSPVSTVSTTAGRPTTLPPGAPPSPSDFSLGGLPDALMQAGCQGPTGTTEWEATAWPFGAPGNAATASHFAQACGAGGNVVFYRDGGSVTATLTSNNPTRDVATYSFNGRERGLSTSTAYVGEEVALVGFPGGNSDPAENPVQISYGRVSALKQTQTLTMGSFTETLTDAITVNSLSNPTHPGMSGGAAFDTSNDVVGVIEGGSDEQAVLTPVQDLPTTETQPSTSTDTACQPYEVVSFTNPYTQAAAQARVAVHQGHVSCADARALITRALSTPHNAEGWTVGDWQCSTSGDGTHTYCVRAGEEVAATTPTPGGYWGTP